MRSNPPESRPAVRPLVGAAIAALLVVLAALWAPGAGAQTDPSAPPSTVAPTVAPTTVPPLRSPTTLPDDPFASNCSPGEIVQRPDCGREPVDAGDPGGWLQVSLFFLTCAVILGMVGFIWWRSRAARDERRRAGLDPVDVARRSGSGTRAHPS